MACRLPRQVRIGLQPSSAVRRHLSLDSPWSSTRAWALRSSPSATSRSLATSSAAFAAAQSKRPAIYNAPIPNAAFVKPPSRPLPPQNRPEWFTNLERRSLLRSDSKRRRRTGSDSSAYASEAQIAAEEAEVRLADERTALQERRDAAWSRMVASMEATELPGAQRATVDFTMAERDVKPKALAEAEQRLEVLRDEMEARKAVETTVATVLPAAKNPSASVKGLSNPALRGPVPETERIVFRAMAPLRRSANSAFLIMIALSFIGAIYAGLLLQTPMSIVQTYPKLAPIVKLVAWALLVGSQLFAYLTWRGIFRTVSFVSLPASHVGRITPSTPLTFYSLSYQLHPMIRDAFYPHTFAAGALHCKGRLTTRDLGIEGVGRELTNPVTVTPVAGTSWHLYSPGRWGEETSMSEQTVRVQLEDVMGLGEESLVNYVQFSVKQGVTYNLKVLVVRVVALLPSFIGKRLAGTKSV